MAAVSVFCKPGVSAFIIEVDDAFVDVVLYQAEILAVVLKNSEFPVPGRIKIDFQGQIQSGGRFDVPDKFADIPAAVFSLI